MSTRLLTDLFVRSVEPPAHGQVDYWDSKLSGFGLRVSATGRKTWTCFYRFQGRSRRLTIGTFPKLSLSDARTEAKAKLREAELGKTDPAQVKREARVAETFGELAEEYLNRRSSQKRPATRYEEERILNRELIPLWPHTKATEIKRKDVIHVLDRIMDRRKEVMANRTKALISMIFTFGVEREVVESNPAYKLRNPGRETSRKRVLTPEEVSILWSALAAEPERVQAVFKIALLTGQRKGEVCGMKWEEIDLETGWWTIPGERTKNGSTHRVFLAPQALEIIKGIAAKPHDNKFVFRGGHHGKPYVNLQKAMVRLKDVCRFEFRFHDLRRTVATLLAGSGVSRFIVKRVINHSDPEITDVYDRHTYDEEKREALEEWDAQLARIVAPKSPKVVPMRAA